MAQDFGTPYPPVDAPPKKSNTTLIIIIVVAVLLLCCCLILGGGLVWTVLNAANSQIYW